MSNHDIHRKRARRQRARRIATRERELQELDRTEITVATPQEVAQELSFQRARIASWITDGSIRQREPRVKEIARKLGLL